MDEIKEQEDAKNVTEAEYIALLESELSLALYEIESLREKLSKFDPQEAVGAEETKLRYLAEVAKRKRIQKQRGVYNRLWIK